MYNVESLLKHLLELVAEGERNLRGDEALKYAANYAEHHHLHDALNVLPQHVVHHVRIAHRSHRVNCFDLLVQITIWFVAIERFACFH